MSKDGRYDLLTKKEVQKLERERKHLDQNLAGIKDMPSLPDALFVVDSHKEEIAVLEARKLGVPVVGIVDTNCDPDYVDYVVPGNDDALRAIRLFTSRIADAVLEGKQAAGRSSLRKRRRSAEKAAEELEVAREAAAMRRRSWSNRVARRGTGRCRRSSPKAAGTFLLRCWRQRKSWKATCVPPSSSGRCSSAKARPPWTRIRVTCWRKTFLRVQPHEHGARASRRAVVGWGGVRRRGTEV